ncbi:hypothetical protein SCH4B_0099 [Ruegeria sp. TrichCH4B]|nr:hypothetical protein SCH4B_0099 [Ruegeria sp. TrichCH4B]
MEEFSNPAVDKALIYIGRYQMAAFEIIYRPVCRLLIYRG